MYQYALVEDGMTIHSSPQMEWNQVSVDDWSWVGGHQCLLTLDGYQRPLNMHCGQAYSAMDMCPFTDKDWDHLSHVTLMLKTPWDPWVLDLEQSNHRHNLKDWLATPYLQSLGLHKVYHSDLTHNVSQLVCEKSSFWGGGICHHHHGEAQCHGGAEFDAKECWALTVINTNQPQICMRKPNPSATFGAPMSLMWTSLSSTYMYE